MKTFEQRFKLAIKFECNAKDTDQENNREGNATWLQRAGYKEEESTDHLLDMFKRISVGGFSRRQKRSRYQRKTNLGITSGSKKGAILDHERFPTQVA
jgi:hypothetical protein